jgi:PTS system ascorbate-specific IIC component
MIMLFFPGGGAGVFGNAFGGWRGAVLGGAVNGVFLAVGQALTWGMLSDTAPELATLADPDWYIITWLILFVSNPFSGDFTTLFGWAFVVLLGVGAWAYTRKTWMRVPPPPPKAAPARQTRPRARGQEARPRTRPRAK